MQRPLRGRLDVGHVDEPLDVAHAEHAGQPARQTRRQCRRPGIGLHQTLAPRVAIERAQRREAAADRTLGQAAPGQLAEIGTDRGAAWIAPVSAAPIEEIEVLRDGCSVAAARVLGRVASGEPAEERFERLGASHAARRERRVVGERFVVDELRREPVPARALRRGPASASGFGSPPCSF